MNTLLLEHFAAVSKIAAVRQSRERQQRVDCSQGYLGSTDAGLLFDGPRTLEVFFKYVPDSSSQFPIALSTSMMCFELSPSNVIRFFCGTSSLETPIVPNQDYHATISYDGNTAQAYLNGTLVGTITPKAYAVASSFRIGHVSYPPKGPVYFARIYNYAISAEEDAAFYNNGDPAGYVLPGAYKRPGNSYVSNFTTSTERWTALNGSILTYDEANHVLELDSVANQSAHMFSPVSYDTRDSHVYDIEVVIDANPKVTKCDFYPYTATELITLPVEYLEETTVFRGVYIPGPRNSFSNNIYCYFSLSTPTIVRVRSIRVLPVGCVAEYLPQNLIVASKQDFPQVVFPTGQYTPSAEVFRVNDPNLTTSLNNQPQSNGFSGDFMRFDSIKQISTYCAYWNSYLKKNAPIKITLEYRSNYAIYISQETTNAALAQKIGEANEAAPIAVSFVYGLGHSAFLLTVANINDGWLEIRVLSIEVVEDVCIGWLDSAKQLPLNDEYLPPLLETAEGYDLTANGTPEIVYKPE